MAETPNDQPAATIPDDDLSRQLTVAAPDSPDLPHIAVVGDTYTVLLSGEDTGGRFAISTCWFPRAAARRHTATTSTKPSTSSKAPST